MQNHFQSVPGPNHQEISALTLARRVIDAGAEWLNRLRPNDAVPLPHRQAKEDFHGA
jgi:hypothetical protein